MPFKSKQQVKYMFATHPKLAREMADKTESIKSLPKRVNKLSKLAKKSRNGTS